MLVELAAFLLILLAFQTIACELEYCGAAFDRRVSLHNHQWLVHQGVLDIYNQQQLCAICEQTFGSCQELSFHRLVVHKDGVAHSVASRRLRPTTCAVISPTYMA